jgi:hypothetical protein
LICEFGFCQPDFQGCRINTDCADGEICQDGVCAAGVECQNARDCRQGELCVANQCVPAAECVNNADCEANQLCRQGFCAVRPCRRDAQCGDGQLCINNQCELVQCVVNEDCNDFEACFEGECFPVECRDDAQCPPGLSCQDFSCQPGFCQSDADCPDPSTACLGGLCQFVECREDAQCPDGFSCQDFSCQPAFCRTDRDCRVNEQCIGGQCFPVFQECLRDADCGGDLICEGNQCLQPQGCATSDDCAASSAQDTAQAQAIRFAARPAPTQRLTLSDDQVSPALPIGFTVSFFGRSFDTLQVSSNGFVTLGGNNANAGCCSGAPLPDAGSPTNLIALYWEDLNPGAGGSILVGTQGAAPNREFVVMFDRVPHFGDNAALVTGQIVLKEGSADVDVFCERCTPEANGGGQHTQGVQNGSGAVAATLPGRNAANFTLNNDGVRFTTGRTQGLGGACLQGQCIEPIACMQQVECELGVPGFSCSGGFCQVANGCSSDAQCPGAQSCFFGACLDLGNPECVRDDQCGGALCEANVCQ